MAIDDAELMQLVEREVADFEQLAIVLQHQSSFSQDLSDAFVKDNLSESELVSDECYKLPTLEQGELVDLLPPLSPVHLPATTCVPDHLAPFLLNVFEKLEQLQSQVNELQSNARQRRPWASNAGTTCSNAVPPQEVLKEDTPDEDEEHLPPTSHVQMDQWKQRVLQELQKRQRAQQLNAQLRQLVRRQQQVSQQMNQLLVSRMEHDRTLWRIYDAMHGITNARRQQLLAESMIKATPATVAPWMVPVPQMRFKWLVKRLEFSLQQIDLVFQGHQRVLHPVQLLQATTVTAPHQLKVRCVKSNGNGNDFVELVGSTVTCFDANTLMNLLWKCFAWKPPSSPASSTPPAQVHASASPTISPITTPSKYARKTSKKRRHVASSVGNLVEKFEKRLVGRDAVHWRADFDTMLSQLHVSVQVNALLKRLGNAFLLEGIGQMALQESELEHGGARFKGTSNGFASIKSCRAHAIAASWKTFPKKIAISRSVWFRVEPLADGRSAIHHVHRITPLDSLVEEAKEATGAEPGPQPFAQRQQPTPQQHAQHHAFKMELLTELLQHAHSEMAIHFQQVILEHLLTQTPAFDHGWPLEGTMF